jgi:hypothetical protein
MVWLGEVYFEAFFLSKKKWFWGELFETFLTLLLYRFQTRLQQKGNVEVDLVVLLGYVLRVKGTEAVLHP